MKYLSLVFALLIILPLKAQDYRTTEELQVEKLFIEATSKRILGAFEEAATLYERVLELDPTSHAAAYELARVYDSLGKRNEGLDAIEKAIRMHDQNPWYYVMKADILEKQEKYADAAETYAYLIDHFPDERYYYEHLVDLYKRTGQLKKGLEVLRRYEKRMGITESVIREQFDLYNQVGDTANALDALERLLRTYPNDTEYLHLIATYCIQLGEEEKARAYYTRILEQYPEDARARLALAREYKATGMDVDYLRSIEDLIANPSIELDAKIQELLPFTERLTREPDSVLNASLIALTDKLLRAHPNEAKVYAIRGDLFSMAGDLQSARSAYERTVQLDKSVFPVWEQLLYILAEQHDADALVKMAQKALDVFPNQATIYYLGGLGHFENEDYSDAVSMLQQALIMTSRQPDLQVRVLTLLGNVYYENGEPSKASQAFDRAMEISPDSPLLLLQYGTALAAQGKHLDKAWEYAQKANRLQPDQPENLHLLARIAYLQEEFKTARDFAELAMGKGYDSYPAHLELYGDILFSMEDVEAAVTAWGKALQQDKGNSRLRKKIDERKIVH